MNPTEVETKIDRCLDMVRKCNRHLQTYIRRSIVVDNDYLRGYARRAVLRKARHILKLAAIVRRYQKIYYQNGGK